MKSLVTKDEKEVNTVARQMKSFVDSGLLPEHIKTPQAAFAIAQMGCELGLQPFQAFNGISVIKGKPTLSAELMLGIIRRDHPGATINFLELSGERCVIKARRDSNHEETTISFSMDDAKLAGLDTGYNWKKYPRALLRSRCVSEMARTLFPDALGGFSYTPEELGGEADVEREVPEAVTAVFPEPQPRPVNPEVEEPLKNYAPNPEPASLPAEPSISESLVVESAPVATDFPVGSEPIVEVEKEPGSGLGDFVYEVGLPSHPYYGKPISEMSWDKKGKSNIFKVQKFLSSKIQKSKDGGWQVDSKEEAALFMIDKYIEEQNQLNK